MECINLARWLSTVSQLHWVWSQGSPADTPIWLQACTCAMGGGWRTSTAGSKSSTMLDERINQFLGLLSPGSVRYGRSTTQHAFLRIGYNQVKQNANLVSWVDLPLVTTIKHIAPKWLFVPGNSKPLKVASPWSSSESTPHSKRILQVVHLFRHEVYHMDLHGHPLLNLGLRMVLDVLGSHHSLRLKTFIWLLLGVNYILSVLHGQLGIQQVQLGMVKPPFATFAVVLI